MLAADADALLRVGRPDVLPRSGAQEDVLELVHPGVGEEQRRVAVRDDRSARDDPVAAARRRNRESSVVSREDVITPQSASSAEFLRGCRSPPCTARARRRRRRPCPVVCTSQASASAFSLGHRVALISWPMTSSKVWTSSLNRITLAGSWVRTSSSLLRLFERDSCAICNAKYTKKRALIATDATCSASPAIRIFYDAFPPVTSTISL